MKRPDDPRHLEELWRYEGLRVGSIGAMKDLLEAHHAEMVRLARIHVPADEVPGVVRRSWATALGGLSMFVWNTSFRSWLLGILLAEARAQHGHAQPEPPGRLLAARPEQALGTQALDELPWTGWWDPGTWTAIQAWLDRRPTVEEELVILRDVLGWPADEARDVVGWTDAHAEELLGAAHHDLAGRLAEEMELKAVPDGVDALLAQLPTAPIEDPDPVLLMDFRDWRSERGLTIPKRVAGQLRRRRRLRPPDALLPLPG